jgi:serine/threonine protein kinase
MENGAIAHVDALVGATLLGRYRVLERIGAGAMGAVYRAEQVGLGRPVALKVLKKQQDAGSDVMARFEREARAMSALTHPNTVRVYDFGATREGQLFLAMELLEGELASNRLGRSGVVSAKEAITWVQQILRSVGEAHAKGIIHRDIKPDNIFLAHAEGSADPVAKVLDFGIAKSIEGEQAINQFETQDGTVFGTPRYMSPEQAQGKALDHRSDLYAVGIVLYELLVGVPPFVDKDAVIVMAKHIREEPAPLHVAAPTRAFPNSLQRVLDKALNKSPAMRFQNAEEFDRALDRCLRYADLLERVPQRGRRMVASALSAPQWTHWALGATVLLLAATSTLALNKDRNRSSKHRPTTEQTTALIPAPKPPEATPLPSAAPPAPPPPAPESHMVTLYTEPKGANVWHYSRFVGTTPLPIDVQDGRSVRVRVSMAGFESQTLDLAPNEGSRVIKLERSAAQARVSAPAESTTLTQRDRPHHARKTRRANATDKPTESDSARDTYEKF